MTTTRITGTESASGDNELIAAPGAGYKLVIYYFMIENESSTATTMILKDGSTAKYRRLGQNQGDGLTREFPRGDPWELAENAALNLNLSGANQCGYNVEYETVAT